MAHTNVITSIEDQLHEIEVNMFEDLENLSIRSCTIFKVNAWLRESNLDAYTPKMVSIGPYHNKNPQLHRMEKYKLLYLRRFLQRRRGLDVKSCINELVKLKENALKCYEDIEDDSQFCQMLLLDGCFVVEFIRERCGIYPQREDKIINTTNIGHIFKDLMLIENQLPFFVLNQLHDMTKLDNNELPLAILVGISFPFFADHLPETNLQSIIETGGYDNIKHLLHLVHKQSCHGNRKKEFKKDETWNTVMPNATELYEAGSSFAKDSNINSNKDNITSLFDIKFENGLMIIPCFSVEDGTENLLRNLIAYEQQSLDVQPKYFCDFATFMDDLIETDKDVNLLRQKGIIVNWIGEDKEVANLFNKIGKGVNMYPDFYYKEECIKAVEHCKKPWNKMKANLLRNYFSSPWVGASTVAAIVLLILTFIQTVLAFTGSVNK